MKYAGYGLLRFEATIPAYPSEQSTVSASTPHGWRRRRIWSFRFGSPPATGVSSATRLIGDVASPGGIEAS